MISEITIGGGFDCDNPVQVGVTSVLRLFNYDDIEAYTVSTAGKILSITLKAGKQGYRFEGIRNDSSKSEEVVKGNLESRFIHRVSFVIYDMSQKQKNNIKAMAKGRFVAITESNGKTADAFELIGKEAGLALDESTIRDAYANGGLFVLGLSSLLGELERKLPQTVGTDYENAIEIVDGITPDDDHPGIFDRSFDFTFN